MTFVNVICYSFNFWGLVRFWFDGRRMLLVSILFSCHVRRSLFYLFLAGCDHASSVSVFFFAIVQMSNQGRVRSRGGKGVYLSFKYVAAFCFFYFKWQRMGLQ